MSLNCVTEEQQFVTSMIQLSEQSLAAFITLVIFSTFIVLSNLKNYLGLRYIAYFNLSNLIWCITGIILNAISLNDTSLIIKIISFLHTYSWFCSMIWNLLFSINLYFAVSGRTDLEKFERYAILMVCGLALVASCITNHNTTTYYSFPITMTIFISFVMLATIIIYIKIFLNLKEIADPEVSTKLIKDLAIYPLVSFVAMILFIIETGLNKRNNCYGLTSLILSTLRFSQPVFDGLIFYFNSTLRFELKEYKTLNMRRRKTENLSASFNTYFDADNLEINEEL